MFFAKAGQFEPCGLFGVEHLVFFVVTFLCVGIAIHKTKNKSKEEVKKIIKNVSITLWILEIIKIVFNLASGNASNPNTYIPLYFCSLILYASVFSGFGNGMLKKIGDVFIATGGLIGGIFFLICPNTSTTIYPAFHYITMQSFIFHGAMVYLGVLVNVTRYVELNKRDVIYYVGFITITGVIAYILNLFLDSNLMFVSKNYPNSPVEFFYNISGRFFPLVMILGQATLPFYIVYSIMKTKLNKEIEKEKEVALVS